MIMKIQNNLISVIIITITSIILFSYSVYVNSFYKNHLKFMYLSGVRNFCITLTIHANLITQWIKKKRLKKAQDCLVSYDKFTNYQNNYKRNNNYFKNIFMFITVFYWFTIGFMSYSQAKKFPIFFGFSYFFYGLFGTKPVVEFAAFILMIYQRFCHLHRSILINGMFFQFICN